MFNFSVICCATLCSVHDEKNTLCIGLNLSLSDTVEDIDSFIESGVINNGLEPSDYRLVSIQF